MSRTRSIVGVIAGVVIALSSLPHGLLGWPQLRAALAATRAPEDLIRSLAIGWYFGSVTILAFGAIATATFARRLRGATVSLTPARIVAVAYVAFGVWALAITRFEPFFLAAFVVPGLLVAFAAFGRERVAAS